MMLLYQYIQAQQTRRDERIISPKHKDPTRVLEAETIIHVVVYVYLDQMAFSQMLGLPKGNTSRIYTRDIEGSQLPKA